MRKSFQFRALAARRESAWAARSAENGIRAKRSRIRQGTLERLVGQLLHRVEDERDAERQQRRLRSRRELGAAGEAHLAQAEEQRRAEAAEAVFAAPPEVDRGRPQKRSVRHSFKGIENRYAHAGGAILDCW